MLCGDRRIPLAELHAAGTAEGHRFEAKRKAYLSPRTVAFNVHGVRLAVHRVTGEIRILHSVHARRYRPADQSDAVPRPDRRRDRHGDRLGADREHGARRQRGRWSIRACATTASPPSPTCRRARCYFADTLRPHRPARRQVPGRVRDQPGRTRDRQCAGRRDRRALRASAPDAGPHLRRSRRRRDFEPTASGRSPIVTQTRVRDGATDAFARLQATISAAVGGAAGLHRAIACCRPTRRCRRIG